MLVEKIGDFKEMVLGKIKEMVAEKIIKAGIMWLIGMLNPVGAFIKACQTIYNVVMFFVENGERIKTFIETIIDAAGDIARGGMPVVGSDGMLIEQYKEPLVWPVATATVSTMRIMAKYGYDRGARKFGIVYDNQYKFGLEGADAFKSYVQSLPGAELKSYVGIRPGESSYGTEVQKFNSDCGSDCDMVAMLLEPSTAETWIAGRPVRGKMLTTGAQTLFNRRFAQNCRAACQDMLVWTGYNPPIDALASLPGVADYVNDVKAIDPGIDTTNAFAEGAYLGMSVFVEALRRVGPNLTRDRLRQVLDSLDLTTDMASPLSWRPDHRFANSRAQAFSLQYAGDDFSGFRNEQTGWIVDPRPSSGV